MSSDLSDGQEITTLNGAKVKITINSEGVFVNDAKVTVADLVADNGVVHVINAVLLPPPSSSTDLVNDNTFSILPNPARDIITFKSELMIDESAKLDIYTVNGQNVISSNVLSGNTIDISQLNSGIYIINIKAKDRIITKKLVKH